MDSFKNPLFVKLRIKQSKTDLFRYGVLIVLSRTRADLCPVEALLAYLARRGHSPGPLFRFESGQTLWRAALVVKMRRAFTAAGVDASRFAGHSFRIGVTTTAAARGLDDSTIRTLGRSKSARICATSAYNQSNWLSTVAIWRREQRSRMRDAR